MDRTEWLNDLELPYTMKKEELLKEKLFFDEHTSEADISYEDDVPKKDDRE